MRTPPEWDVRVELSAEQAGIELDSTSKKVVVSRAVSVGQISEDTCPTRIADVSMHLQAALECGPEQIGSLP